MPGIHDLALFVVSGLLLNITPGPDFVFIVGRSAALGFRAGVWAALGIGAGCFVHVSAAALGLSAMLAASAAAFTFIKWAGAAYLVYVGLSMWRETRQPAVTATADGENKAASHNVATHAAIFRQGLLTNVLNPKVALFFLAFVPQFIDSSSPGKVTAFLLLGLVFNINGTLWNIFVAWATARMLKRVGAAQRMAAPRRWLNRVLGGFFIVLGAKLALAERA